MVIGAFPIAKLSVLLIKQISKPIANICKERAKSHPFFRTYVCMPPAQFYNWCEVKAKMWVLNLGKPVNIPVLSQEMAIELGANLLGETVIFVIGASLLLIEYNRQSKKETAKEEKREAEMNHITSTITDLYFTVQQQQTQLREMERIVYSISGKKPEISSPPSLAPPTGSPPSEPPIPACRPSKLAQPDIERTNDGPSATSTPCANNFYGTPYPNKGIILQSLNFIQMDAVSSLFHSTGDDVIETRINVDPDTKHTRENAVLSIALYNIENNLRSLF